MSRKSVSRKSSRSPVPPLEKSYPDEQRLGLNNIVQINPWKDIGKYDKEEVGQIQEILVQFNNMIVDEKKNKRRSVGKGRAPTLDTKVPPGNEVLEEASTTKESTKNDKKQCCKSDSNTSFAIEEKPTTNKTSGVQNTHEKPVEEPEEHLPSQKKERSSKLKNHVEHIVPLEDKMDKRKSIEKRQASSSSSKPTNDAYLDMETPKNKMMRNYNRKNCVNKATMDISKNRSIENTSDNQNIEETPIEEDEDHPEEKEENSSKSTYSVELDMLNDKNRKYKFVEKRQASTSLSNPTNDAYLDVETPKNKMMRNNNRKSCVNEATIDISKNRSIKNTSDNQNIEETPMEEDEDHPEETSKNSSKSNHSLELDMLNDKKKKRKSVEKRQSTTSSIRAIGSNAATSKKKEKMGRDAIQQRISESSVNNAIINVPENVATENSSNNQNTVDKERKVMREENKDLSSEVIKRGEQRFVEKRLISSSQMKTIASNNAKKRQSTLINEKFQYLFITSDGAGSIVEPEENIDLGHKRDDINIESSKKKLATQKLEKIRDETVSEAQAEQIAGVYATFTVQLPEISGSVSPASRNDKLSYIEGIELQNHESSWDNGLAINESIISGHLSYPNFQVFSSTNKLEKLDPEAENRTNSVLQKDDNLVKQSSAMKPRSVSAEPERKTFAEYSDDKSQLKNTLNPESEKTDALKNEAELPMKQLSTMKACSVSVEPDYKKFSEYNNNPFKSEHARKHEEKIAKAFEKFGKKFMKYSSRMEQPQIYESESSDDTIDSESDSSSSDSSSNTSGSSSDADESSCSESTSSSTSSSTYSSYSGSSSYSSYTSYSSITSCSCPSCCEDDMYSEYTLASSSNPDPGSDDSSDSSMD